MNHTQSEIDFIRGYNELALAAHWHAIDRGDWCAPKEDSAIFASMHRELLRALDAANDGDRPSPRLKGRSLVEERLADLVIRVMDAGAMRQWRVGEAVADKMRWREQVESMKGGWV